MYLHDDIQFAVCLGKAQQNCCLIFFGFFDRQIFTGHFLCKNPVGFLGIAGAVRYIIKAVIAGSAPVLFEELQSFKQGIAYVTGAFKLIFADAFRKL